MSDESDLQKLLRLKRYEQPPPKYFENFLHDFHRRQRAELLREPLWKIARDRFVAFFSERVTSGFGYAMASAMVLLVAGITSFKIVNSPRQIVVPPDRAVAQNFTLSPHVQLPDDLFSQTAHSATASLRPRYVMDARPVSYEPASSF
ncbi:MAG: hypothetical protein QOD99_2308 [Chthoniobacter sp.]|jgi:hypothetical protein|nr:hypothetical protein [Chthoniobacter sp.]